MTKVAEVNVRIVRKAHPIYRWAVEIRVDAELIESIDCLTRQGAVRCYDDALSMLEGAGLPNG